MARVIRQQASRVGEIDKQSHFPWGEILAQRGVHALSLPRKLCAGIEPMRRRSAAFLGNDRAVTPLPHSKRLRTIRRLRTSHDTGDFNNYGEAGRGVRNSSSKS